MCSWFCPLEAEWGNIAEVVQAIAAVMAVVAVFIVWWRQSTLTQRIHNELARFNRELQKEQLERGRELQAQQEQLSRNLQREQIELSRELQREQLGLSRELHKQSLMPYIHTSVRVGVKDGELIIEPTFSNRGFGPAVVRDVEAYFDGELIEAGNDSLGTPILKKLREALGVTVSNSKIDMPAPEEWIEKSSVRSFVSLRIDPARLPLPARTNPTRAGLAAAARLKIVMNYESLFGDLKTAIVDIPPPEN